MSSGLIKNNVTYKLLLIIYIDKQDLALTSL